MQDIEIWYFYGLFAFFSTFSVYNGQRLIKSTHPTQTPWLSWVQRNEKALYLATFASGLMTVSALMMIGNISLDAVLILSASGIISLFYVLPIKGVIMREIPYIKIYLIAFTWAAVLIVFPMLNEDKFSWIVVLHALGTVFYVIAVAIPFDIRDVKFDRLSQRTIPQVIGVNRAKLISVLLILSFLGIMLIFSPVLISQPAFYLAVFIQMLLLLFMHEDRGDLYCAGGIDGAIGLIGLSYFLAGITW